MAFSSERLSLSASLRCCLSATSAPFFFYILSHVKFETVIKSNAKYPPPRPPAPPFIRNNTHDEKANASAAFNQQGVVYKLITDDDDECNSTDYPHAPKRKKKTTS